LAGMEDIKTAARQKREYIHIRRRRGVMTNHRAVKRDTVRAAGQHIQRDAGYVTLLGET
jgi:hypothetical protein